MVSCINCLPLHWFGHFDLLIPSIIFFWLLLHPWRTEGLLVVMASVPFLWILTPSSPGWNIVVYPSSGILFMLRSDCLSPGNMWASLAASDNCLNGSLVLCDVFSGGILPYWILHLLVSLVLCTQCWMLHRSLWLICALFFLPAVSSICLMLVLLLLFLSLMCLFFLYPLHFCYCCC